MTMKNLYNLAVIGTGPAKSSVQLQLRLWGPEPRSHSFAGARPLCQNCVKTPSVEGAELGLSSKSRLRKILETLTNRKKEKSYWSR
jgi:hypothetical protein